MGAFASIGVLLSVASALQRLVQVFVVLYIILIFAWVILSWVDLPYSRTTAAVQQFLDEVCRPYIDVFRRRLPTLGPVDVSPVVAIFVLAFMGWIVVRLIGALL